MPSIGHEMQRLVLIPLGKLAAAKHEPELLALWQFWGKVLKQCSRTSKGVVDLHLFVGLLVWELGRPAADGPASS